MSCEKFRKSGRGRPGKNLPCETCGVIWSEHGVAKSDSPVILSKPKPKFKKPEKEAVSEKLIELLDTLEEFDRPSDSIEEVLIENIGQYIDSERTTNVLAKKIEDQLVKAGWLR